MTAQIIDSALVKIVETYPILYDKVLARGTKNAHKKDEAWRQVSLEMGASERACITRWKSIRDRFGKEYRRICEHPDEPVTWDMFPQLMFLKDHYKYGFAQNDELPDIKFEPKPGKRRRRPPPNLNDCELSNNEEESQTPEEEHFFNQRLIHHVKEHEVIYDKIKIRDSKNLTAKNEAWQRISESMNISEETCYKRWKKLRDRFARECRNHLITPDKPVEWEYYEDLLFLEKHYRKGVPLNVETLKRPGRPQKYSKVKTNANAQVKPVEQTEDLSTFQCMQVEQNETLDETLGYEDTQNLTYTDCPTEMSTTALTKDEQDLYSDAMNEEELIDQTLAEDMPDEEPVEQLCAVIDNIEAVLQQSQDCLQSLRAQQKRHRKELNNAASNSYASTQPLIFQKMNVLLDGLSAENRAKAEVKIVKFLCECQIKALNNEEIEDVSISLSN